MYLTYYTFYNHVRMYSFYLQKMFVVKQYAVLPGSDLIHLVFNESLDCIIFSGT